MQVDVFEGVQVHVLALAFQIHHLAPHQAGGAGGEAEFAHHRQQSIGGNPRAAQGHHLEGAGEQGIAGQDGVGLAVHLVIGGSAAAQVVVVHGGEIVMDQRHGVDHLQGNAGGHGQFAVGAGQLAGRQAEDRPQALASRQQGVAHGLPEALGSLGPQGGCQGCFHPQASGLQIGGKIERDAHRRGHGWVGSGRILSAPGPPGSRGPGDVATAIQFNLIGVE